MALTRKEIILNTFYSLLGGVFIFFGVYKGIKYSLLISIAYGVGFFIWSELFLYTLKILSEEENSRGGKNG